MAYNEKLATRVRDFFRKPDVPFEEKRMMGDLCFMVNAKMCVGVEKDRLMARIDPDIYDQALTRKGCVPMDFTSRPMRGFVFIQTVVARFGGARLLTSRLAPARRSAMAREGARTLAPPQNVALPSRPMRWLRNAIWLRGWISRSNSIRERNPRKAKRNRTAPQKCHRDCPERAAPFVV